MDDKIDRFKKNSVLRVILLDVLRHEHCFMEDLLDRFPDEASDVFIFCDIISDSVVTATLDPYRRVGNTASAARI